jgi:hypothetical protein
MDRRQRGMRSLRIVIMSEHEIRSLREPKPQPEPQPWSSRSWAFSERRQIIERRILTHDRRGRGPDRRLPDLLPQAETQARQLFQEQSEQIDESIARIKHRVIDRRVEQIGPRISADVLGRRFAVWWERVQDGYADMRVIERGSVLAEMAEKIERRGTPAGEGRTP